MFRHGRNRLEPDVKTHGIWQLESELTHEGISEVVRASETYLHDLEPAYMAHSGIRRAWETALISMPALRDRWVVEKRLGPKLRDELDAAARSIAPDKQITTIEDMAAHVKGFRMIEGNWIHGGFIHALLSIKHGQTALLVSHQPLIGLLCKLYDKGCKALEVGSELPKAGILRFRFRGMHEFSGIETFLPPPPSDQGSQQI